MNLHLIGIDLGKTVFHLVGLSQTGAVVVRKKFSRTQLLRFTANVCVDLIGMQACAGSHFLGKALREQGHEVRLMPAQSSSAWRWPTSWHAWHGPYWPAEMPTGHLCWLTQLVCRWRLSSDSLGNRYAIPTSANQRRLLLRTRL